MNSSPDDYITLLERFEKQLADAKNREKLLLRAVRYYDGVREKWAEYASSCCRGCFKLVFTPKRCQVCPKWKWKCRECASNQQILTCGGCKRNICNECDPTISPRKEETWTCVSCIWIKDIKKKCAENLELLKAGEITRSQAIVTCCYARFPRHDHFISFVYQTLKLDEWFVFLGDQDGELEADFPEAEDQYDLVITPAYSVSPKSIELAKLVAQKFFPDDPKADDLRSDGPSWNIMLDNMSNESYEMGRKTYSVKELVRLWVDCGDMSKEEEEAIDPELLARIFD